MQLAARTGLHPAVDLPQNSESQISVLTGWAGRTLIGARNTRK